MAEVIKKKTRNREYFPLSRGRAGECLRCVEASVAVDGVALRGGGKELVSTFVCLQSSHHGHVVGQF